MNLVYFIFSIQVGSLLYLAYWFDKRLRKVEAICEKRRKAIEVLDSIAKNLTDPAKIEADMDAAANRREMLDAQRTTMPREGAGPPAKVYRPKLRNVPRKQ